MKGKITKRKIYEAQHARCFFCKDPLDYHLATSDHFIPRSACKKFLAGGGGMWWHLKYKNIVISCRYCNTKKANRMPTETEQLLYHRVYGQHPPTAASLKGITLKEQVDESLFTDESVYLDQYK